MKWAKKYISIYNQPLDNVHEGIIQEINAKTSEGTKRRARGYRIRHSLLMRRGIYRLAYGR